MIWGPGRHKAGDNTFSYFLDPHGNTIESRPSWNSSTRTPGTRTCTTSPTPTSPIRGTANPMNELVAKESFNDPDRGVFVAPPV